MRGYAKDNPFPRERELLGKTIRKIRESKKLTQEDLAEKADVNVSYLAKIENGYINMSLRYMIKIASGLRIKVKDLIEF